MSHVKNTTLLEYVIAYLQEELTRTNHKGISFEMESHWIKFIVDEAIDTWNGGAR